MNAISPLNFRTVLVMMALLLPLIFMNCAKKGMPSGGARDTIPPMVVQSVPKNFSTDFKGSEIDILFDEYIKLNNVQQELIVSPPLQYDPFITPLNVSKSLTIKINDTLEPNTTYVFNFGNSIEDNNEGNVYPFFKYVFSTGDYIDSLKLTGRVRDAHLRLPEFPATVMLYEANETYNDSIVYSEKPRYVAITNDTTGVFELTNLKEGTYRLIALNEKNRNYLFRPEEDKIGFVSDLITIPADSVYVVSMFKEKPTYELARPSLKGKQHLLFGYKGATDSLEITMLNAKPANFSSVIFKDETKDTLYYWYKPPIETDSLVFKVQHDQTIDTVKVKMRELYRDTLNISMINPTTIRLKDSVKLRFSTPLMHVDAEKLEIMTTDSIPVVGSVRINKKYNHGEIYFDKAEQTEYRILALPGMFTDFFGHQNDSLQFVVRTRLNSDYGTLRLTLENAKSYPILVELVDGNYNTVASDYLTEPRNVFFDEINPSEYYLRIIYDRNANGKWDTGDFLNRRHPEEVIYYPRKLDIRANWSLNETFRLGR